MNPRLIGLVLVGLTALGMAQRDDYGQPLGITGVSATEPLEAAITTAKLEGRTLSLELGSARLVITPLPSGLETFPFAGSIVRAERRNHPDGPETRLEFRTSDGQSLVLGSNTAVRSPGVVGWRFESSVGSRFARVRLEGRSAFVQIGRVRALRGEGATWCLRLLALHIPQAAKPGVSLEAEGPRFDWMAMPVGPSGMCTLR
jgi:hypothetical protein